MPVSRNSLGIDYGTQYIGVSHSLEVNNYLVHGYKTISNRDHITQILEIISALEIEIIVVGYPIDINNKKNRMTKLVDDFILELSKHTKIKIDRQNEFNSSQEALEIIRNGKLRPSLVHQISSQIILDDYLKHYS